MATTKTAQTEVASESMKAKISALLAKANGTDNAHEAAAFMSKAMELMEKFQLAGWELRDKEDPMGETAIWSTNKNPVTWKKYLVTMVSMYYGAKAIMHPTAAGWTFNAVGRESARVTTAEMYPFILSQVVAWGKKIAETDTSMNAKQHTRRVCHELTYRLAKLIADRTEQQQAEAAGKAKTQKAEMARNALVAVDELESYLAANKPDLKTGKGGNIGKGAMRAHREAANAVKLEKQVEGGASGAPAGTAQIASSAA